MKVVCTKTTLMLTKDEELTLVKAANLLQNICDQNNDFAKCDDRCPLACYCEKKQCHTIADYLTNVVDESKREE